MNANKAGKMMRDLMSQWIRVANIETSVLKINVNHDIVHACIRSLTDDSIAQSETTSNLIIDAVHHVCEQTLDIGRSLLINFEARISAFEAVGETSVDETMLAAFQEGIQKSFFTFPNLLMRMMANQAYEWGNFSEKDDERALDALRCLAALDMKFPSLARYDVTFGEYLAQRDLVCSEMLAPISSRFIIEDTLVLCRSSIINDDHMFAYDMAYGKVLTILFLGLKTFPADVTMQQIRAMLIEVFASDLVSKKIVGQLSSCNFHMKHFEQLIVECRIKMTDKVCIQMKKRKSGIALLEVMKSAWRADEALHVTKSSSATLSQTATVSPKNHSKSKAKSKPTKKGAKFTPPSGERAVACAISALQNETIFNNHNGECMICLEELDEDTIVYLACRGTSTRIDQPHHTMCASCWPKCGATCPLCGVITVGLQADAFLMMLKSL